MYLRTKPSLSGCGSCRTGGGALGDAAVPWPIAQPAPIPVAPPEDVPSDNFMAVYNYFFPEVIEVHGTAPKAPKRKPNLIVIGVLIGAAGFAYSKYRPRKR